MSIYVRLLLLSLLCCLQVQDLASSDSPGTSTRTCASGENLQEETTCQQETTKQDDGAVRVPIFLIPSLAGSRLRTWSPVNCGGIGPSITHFDTGDTVWMQVTKMMMQTKCWINCLQLDPWHQTDLKDGCRTRPDEGLDAVAVADETIPLTAAYLLKPLINVLASMGYDPDQTMFAHPYDWRLPPGRLEERDASFTRLKQKIEAFVANFRKRYPQSPVRGVLLVGLSLGNLFIQYFFLYLQKELGEHGLNRWADQHIHGLILGGAPWLGSAGPVSALLFGDTMGIPPPYSLKSSRELHKTWGVLPWMFPSAPTVSNPRHAAMNNGETDHPTPTVQVKLRNGTVVKYDNYQHGNDFFGSLEDNNLQPTHHVQQKWYNNDPLIGGGSPVQPWTPPKGIDQIICLYGVNVPTPVGYVFEQQEDSYRTSDIFMNNRGDIQDVQGNSILPKNRRHYSRKSGDGSVPYISLSYCHSWFGEGRVNVSKYPANRRFQEDEVETFSDVDVLNMSHMAEIDHGRPPQGYNTLFEQKWIEEHPSSGLQRLKTIQIWELEGVIHKNTLTDNRVTTLIQWTLSRWQDVARLMMETHQTMISKAREELSKVNVLSSNWMDEMVKEDSCRANPPSTNDDCYWDYYNVACAWPRYCAYQYKIGDLHLGQSCRLREMPLDKDDPQLLLRDYVALNATFPPGSNDSSVEWRIIYRDRHRDYLLPPWGYVFIAFVGGGVAVLFLLYIIFRCYRDQLLSSFAAPSKENELAASVSHLSSTIEVLETEASDGGGSKGEIDDLARTIEDVGRRVRRLSSRQGSLVEKNGIEE